MGVLGSRPMRYLILAAITLSLNSCNTSIGVWRDTCQAVQWTKGKIQGDGSTGATSSDPYNEPVY